MDVVTLDIQIYICFLYQEKRTALHFGAQNGHDSVVDILIRLGANINVEVS